jgi:competence protein ComEA
MASLSVTRSQALAVALALVGVLVVGERLLAHHGGAAAAPATSFPAPTTGAPAPTRVVVDVVGAVRRPGLYRLRDDSRIADAVARAGGATRVADLDQLNLAAPVADGQQVAVARKTRGAAAGAVGATATPTAPVQLSTATVEQLDALPGIGPVTAQKIVDYRQQHGAFSSLDELDAIPGIGPARIDELRGLVVP